MTTENNTHRCTTPSCKSATPGGCSDCTLAYDCARASTGARFAWPLVAIAIVGVLTLAVRGFGG